MCARPKRATGRELTCTSAGLCVNAYGRVGWRSVGPGAGWALKRRWPHRLALPCLHSEYTDETKYLGYE